MGRQHKYKAWHKTEQHWIDGFMHMALLVGLDMMLNNGVANVEVVEWTGLTDKHGKEIYEGDILQEIFMDKVLEWSLWQVVFEQGAFGVRPLPSTGEEPTFRVFHDDVDDFFNLDRYSVISNIYENHNLLERSGNEV